MPKKKQVKVVFSLLVLIAAFGCKKAIPTSSSGTNPSDSNNDTLCFLAGTMKQTNAQSSNSFESMNASVRLQLDAKTKEECVEAAQSYCLARSEHGYAPDAMSVTFTQRSKGNKSIRHGLDKNCTAVTAREVQ